MEQIPQTPQTPQTPQSQQNQPTNTNYKYTKYTEGIPMYSFNGKNYNTAEEANSARETYKAAVTADWESVGKDRTKYDALIASGRGISQMSDDELNFIKDRYAKSDLSKRKEYTKSDTDAYLYAMGLPSSKELNTYRQKYIDYIGDGGVSQYSQLLTKEGDNYYTTEATEWIKDQFAKDTEEGFNGDLVTSKYKDIKYEDTLLDEQLKEMGLPPSSMLNEYFAKYNKDVAVSKKIDEFNEKVYDYVHKDGMSTENAFKTALSSSDFSDLREYYAEEPVMPNEGDAKYLTSEYDSDGNRVVNTEKYKKDLDDYFENLSKRDAMTRRVSIADYNQYEYDKTTELVRQRDEAIYNQSKEKYEQWFTKPATTEAEKKQRAKDVSDFLNFNSYVEETYGGKKSTYTQEDIDRLIKTEPVFQMLDYGVPSSLANKLYNEDGSFNANASQEIKLWNDNENKYNPKAHAEVEAATLLYNGTEGSYNDAVSALSTTWRVKSAKNFDKRNSFNSGIYYKQVGANGVTQEGALYSVIAGQAVDNRAIDLSSVNAESETDSAYNFYSSRDASGKLYADYLTEEEKGVYYYLCSTDFKNGAEYLNDMQAIVSKRSYINLVGDEYQKILSGVASDKEYSDYVYNNYLYEKGEELKGINDNRTDAWKKTAWETYSGLSDNALQRMLDERSDDSVREIVNSGAEDWAEQVDQLQRSKEQIQFVLDVRKDARREAMLSTLLKDYTDNDGALATARAKGKDTGESKYERIINGNYQSGTADAEYELTGANREGVPYEDLAGEKDIKVLRSLTDEQKNRYNYLLYTMKNAEAADAYIDFIYNSADKANSERLHEELFGWVDDNIGTRAAATALSVLVPPATSGVLSILGTIGNAVSGKKTSMTQATLWDFSNEWREEVPTGDLFRWMGMSDENAQKWGQIGYGAVMSMVDSTGAAFLNLLGGDLGTLALASSAFSSSLRSGLVRGLDPDQATGLAFISGLAEYATEKVGLETIMDTVSSFKNNTFGAGEVVKNLLLRSIKPTVTEASEEALSNIVTSIADSLINGDMSEYNEEYNRYIDDGYTPEEAKKLARSNWVSGLIQDAAIGGVTGFLMSSVGMAAGVKSDVQYNAQKNAGIDPNTGELSYDTPNNPNGMLPSQRPAENPVTSERAQAYTRGRTAVEKVFNAKIADGVQNALDRNLIEDEKVSSFDTQLQNADNTDFISKVVGLDSNGKLKLTDDERTALATALSATGEDDLDVAYNALKAQEQTVKQRAANANTNFDGIMSQDKYGNALNTIAENKTKINRTINELQAKYNSSSTELRNSYARQMSTLEQAIAHLESGDIRGATVALNSLQAQNDVVNNKQDASDNFVSDYEKSLNSISENNKIIAETQSQLDRHTATLNNALNFFSLGYGKQKTALRQAAAFKKAQARAGAQKDAILLDNSLDEEAKQKAYDEALKREEALADVGRYFSRYANLRGGRSKLDIMLKVKNGTFSDFVKEQLKQADERASARASARQTQQQGSQNTNAQPAQAQEPAQAQASTNATPAENSANQSVQSEQNAQSAPAPANTGNNTGVEANPPKNGSEAVKQENTEQKTGEDKPKTKERTVKVSQRLQKKYSKLASRFELNIIWGDIVDEYGNHLNGKYDPEHPKNVYLNTSMLTDSDKKTEEVVALEFLRHEALHWVKETPSYKRVKNMAFLYLQEQGIDVDSVIQDILEDNPSYKGNKTLGEEELTAMFVQSVLFGGEDGNRRAIKWLAQSSRRGVFNSLRKYNDYLIARTEIRNAQDGDALKLLLLDAEYAFTQAIEERQMLDGKSAPVANEQTDEERAKDQAEVDELMNDIPPEDIPQGEYEGGAVSAEESYNEVVPLEDELTGNENLQYNQEKNNASEATNGTDAGNSENGAETNGTGNQGNPVVTDGAGRRTVLPQHGLVRRGDSESNNRILTENSERIKSTGAGNYTFVQTDDKQSFVDALTKMRAENESGGSVDPKTVEELADSVTYLSDDASAGYAIEQDGNLTAVFKNRNINSKPYAGVDIILSAVANGADRLDCYGIFLANTYAKGGFVPVARVAYSREYGSTHMNAYIDSERAKGNPAFAKDPDIYFMMLSPDATMESIVDGVANRTAHRYTQEELDALPLMEYDDAKFFRDGLIAQNEQKAQPAQTDTQAQAEARLSEEAQPAQEAASEQAQETAQAEQAPAPVTFNEQQKTKLSQVGSKLANAKQILFYVRGASDYNSAVEAIKDEIIKYIPQNRRRYFKVATEWNGSNYDNLVIVDYDTFRNIPKDSIGTYETDGINLGTQTQTGRASWQETLRQNQERQRQERLAEQQRNEQARAQASAENNARNAELNDWYAQQRANAEQNTTRNSTGKSLSAYMEDNQTEDTFADVERISSHKKSRNTSVKMEDVLSMPRSVKIKIPSQDVVDIINRHVDNKLTDADKEHKYISKEKKELALKAFSADEVSSIFTDAQSAEREILWNLAIRASREGNNALAEKYIKAINSIKKELNQDWATSLGVNGIARIIRSEESLNNATRNRLNRIWDAYTDDSTANNRPKLEDILSIVLSDDFNSIDDFVGNTYNRAQLPTEVSRNRQDVRIYAPKNHVVTEQTWAEANKDLSSASTEEDKSAIMSARKDIVFSQYYSDSTNVLGVSQEELSEKIKLWSSEKNDSSIMFEPAPLDLEEQERNKILKKSPVSAQQKSQEMNRGVSVENRFAGFENASILSHANVTDSDISNLVKEVKGEKINNDAEQYERNFIANVMLSLDTHIDWSGLTVEFMSVVPNETGRIMGKSAETKGDYDPSTHTIRVGKKDALHTLAHEMGHAIDNIWIRDLLGGTDAGIDYLSKISTVESFNMYLNKYFGKLVEPKKTDPNYEEEHDRYIKEKELRDAKKDFYSNFISFVDGLVFDLKTNRSTEYHRRRHEIFARFVSDFVYYVNKMSSQENPEVYESEFNERQYDEFIKILQDKSALDSLDNSYGQFSQESVSSDELAPIGEPAYDYEPTAEDFEVPTAEDYLADLEEQYNAQNAPMYSNGRSLDYYINNYGMKKQTPYQRANNIRTPNQTSKSNRVSNAVHTMKSAPYVPQGLRDIIDNKMLEEGMGVYDPIQLDELREQGAQYIAEHGGITQTMRDLTSTMRDVKAKDVVKVISAANQVFATIAKEGIAIDSQEYADFIAEYIMLRSTWGREGRAMQLLNDSPLARRTYWERVVNRMNEENRNAVQRGLNPLFYRNGYQDIDIPQNLWDDLQNAQTTEQIEKAEQAITEYIGENSPLTVGDALRNWRYFAMLANPVTHMRNMLGNITMQGGRVVKDVIATGLESIAVKTGLMQDSQRTHGIILRQGSSTRSAIESLYQENKKSIQSGGRDGFRTTLNDAKRKSPIKFINWLMNINSNLLENEDELFLHMTFLNAAAQYASAKGIDVTKMTKQQRADLTAYATQQAQEATYRDASKLADALNEFSRSGWIQNKIVEGVMPFKKTPINITKRGLSYSPLGLAKGLVDLSRDVISKSRGGELKVSASKVVDEIAEGLTGTMLSALGFFLAKCGILKLKAGKDDRDDTYERDTGHQNYSLEIGDVSIKIESLAPLTFPLFMGASLYELTSQENSGFSVSDLTDSALSIVDPLMDMSFMSSLNEALDTYSQNGVMGVASNIGWSYLSQYLPTIGSKTNNVINDWFTERRTSKSSAASPLGSTWDYRLRSAASKIPVANQLALEPYVSTTGEYQKSDNFGEYVLSFLNNFVLPTNVTVVDSTPVNNEISRLVRSTGETEFVPQNPTKYLTIGNERKNLTASQYTEYAKDHNETVYAVLTQIIDSDYYDGLTDEQKVDVLKKAYNSAHSSIQKKYQAIYAQKSKK